MKAMHFILSSCGTSLLTNGCDGETRSLVFAHANAPKPIGVKEGERLYRHLEERRRLVGNLPPSEAARYSAEVNGLLHLYEGDFSKGEKDAHVLLATDTWLGEETAHMVAHWLRTQGIGHVEVWDDIGGLRTDDLYNFHAAIADLAIRLAEVVPGYRDKGYRVIFNLTGGFKSIQGVLQTFSQFYADEAVYIFETSTELLRIPRLPVVLDVLPVIREHMRAWRRLALRLPVTYDECAGIPDVFLLKLDKEVALSPWGELVWQHSKKELYQERFWDPPTHAVTWTEKFEKAVARLPSDRLFEINKRMDELALHLERPDHPNPSSLNCHKLEGNPKPGCTHEIYAWSDRDAKRIYGVCHGHSRFDVREFDAHL